MAELNLEKYGISGTTEIIRNPSYEALFAEETKAGLEGYEVGRVRVQERQPPHGRVHLGDRQGHRGQGALQQEAVRRRRVLRRQP